MIEIFPTTNQDLIKRLIKSDAIWDKISQDMYYAKDYSPCMDDLWLKVLADGELCGVYAFDNLRGVCCDIHPYIIPEFRVKAAREGLNLALKYLFNNFDKICKVNATIPIIYRAVYNFSINNGFTHEGINRQSFMKNGVIHDQWLVGVTRLEYEHN